jgi:molybdenum cofactor cytidylyltransferase
MNKNQTTAIILAAGDSSRMGQPKALLAYQGQTFLESIIKNVQLAGVEQLFVITGKHDKQIREKIKNSGMWTYVHNPHPEKGQLSSTQIAIRNVPDSTIGVLQILVDHPQVKLSTYKAIITKALSSPDSIIIPSFNGKNGHPVYFGRKYFPDLLSASIDEGARAVVHNHKNEVIIISVMDSGILQDIDSPQDYHHMNSNLNDTHQE